MPGPEAVLEVATSIVGLSGDPSDPAKRSGYISLIAPGETAQMVASMLNMSGCGLVVAGTWRRAGLTHPLLAHPYRIGSGIARLLQVARGCGAWRLHKRGSLPSPGDMVLVGDNSPSGGVEHVYTVVAVDQGRQVIQSVDGGQKTSRGFQCVLKKQRSWASGRDVVFEGSDPGSRTVGGRKIIGWVEVAKLPWPTEEDIYGP